MAAASTAIQPKTNQATRNRIAREFPDAERILQLARLLYSGGMTSKSVTKPENLAVKIVAGMEVGLSPVQACNNIMIVGGRATIYGDGALALVRESGQLASIKEWIDGTDVEATAYCEVQRKGEAEPRRFKFDVPDAMRAKLWGQVGPWSQYPERMLTMRARAWALRDVFTDVLCGLGIFEEVRDYATDKLTPPPVDNASVPDAETLVNQETLEQIAAARVPWLKSLGVDPNNSDAVRFEWAGKLHFYNVESARDLTQTMAENLLRELIETAKPKDDGPPESLPDVADLVSAAA